MSEKINQPVIKILHIILALNRGGIETWLMHLLRLQRPNIQFDFIVFQKGQMDEEAQSLGATIHYLPFRYPVILRHKKELTKIISENKYDVIHYHGSIFSGIITKIATKYETPVQIIHAHNTQYCGKRFFINTVKEIYRQLIDIPQLDNYKTILLACSQEAGRFYFGKLWKNKKPYEMVYCGIPLEPFDTVIDYDKRKKLCEYFNIPNDAIVIGTFGRLSYQKNHEFLINVFAELAKRNQQYTLFIGGEGDLRPILERQIQKLNLLDRVFLPGSCSNVPELLCQLLDVFVLPSHFEGLPVTTIEAAAAGLHSVCSDSITNEMFQFMPERVTWRNLSDPISKWCDAIEIGIKKRTSPQEGITCLKKTPFEINKSMDVLLYYYNKNKK
ncbi:MAG: glycosyltransferase [Planctomycetaceae bacterium]|jgi:glycosyltransferase involved in cell wall biosynthesis|nr:glycosyltransferase [Planctomycetaceae bacterium]